MKKKFMDFNPFFSKIINLNSKIEFLFLNYNKIKIANSLSFEDIFLSYFINCKNLIFENFLLNTGKLFLSSLNLLTKLKNKYKLNLKIYTPNLVLLNKYILKYGLYSFYNNVILRKICCNIRKLEPLNNNINNSDLWLTGQRKTQSFNRNFISESDFDSKRFLIKCNIIYNWSYKDIYYFIEKFNILINNIHNDGYISIGCDPCTKKVKNLEKIRNGRWWWEKSFKKECGIH